MGSNRHRFLVAALLTVAAFCALADQGPPVYTAIGTVPRVGQACTGPRVQVEATSGTQWCCVNSKWAGCDAAAGGSGYSTVADEGSDLTARSKLNFTGAAVTATDNAGASRTDVTIPFPTLNQVGQPTGDRAFTWPSGAKALWTFTGSTDNAFSIHGDGAFTGTGDLVHINKTGTGAAAGSDALHVEVTSDPNMTGIRSTEIGRAHV